MSEILLPYVSNSESDARSRIWVRNTLAKRRVRDDVIDRVMKRSRFIIRNWSDTSGGGYCYWGPSIDKILVELFGLEHMACVHECAHAFRAILYMDNKWQEVKDRLIPEFISQSFKPLDEYTEVREICRIYREGKGSFPGMWDPEKMAWNDSEIWAGLASATMGVVDMYPPPMREIFLIYYKG